MIFTFSRLQKFQVFLRFRKHVEFIRTSQVHVSWQCNLQSKPSWTYFHVRAEYKPKVLFKDHARV